MAPPIGGRVLGIESVLGKQARAWRRSYNGPSERPWPRYHSAEGRRKEPYGREHRESIKACAGDCIGAGPLEIFSNRLASVRKAVEEVTVPIVKHGDKVCWGCL